MYVVRDIKISSAEYHNRSGFPSRLQLLKGWTTPEQTQASSMSGNFYEYIEYQMSIFERKQREFSQRKVVRLKLKKYICVQRTCVELAKRIIDGHENALIAIGTTKIGGSCPIKGMIIDYSEKIKEWLLTKFNYYYRSRLSTNTIENTAERIERTSRCH